jgi:methylase of polypeptide subunit release factors
MEVIARLIVQAADRLVPGGWLLMEMAAARAAECVAIIERAGLWQDLHVRDDYAGLPRVVRAARRPDDPR